jgi:hypothetical protein
MIIYLTIMPRATATGGPREPYWDARFYPLGEIIAELNRVPESLCERKRMRGLPFERGWPGGFPAESMAEPGFAEPKPCRLIRT